MLMLTFQARGLQHALFCIQIFNIISGGLYPRTPIAGWGDSLPAPSPARPSRHRLRGPKRRNLNPLRNFFLATPLLGLHIAMSVSASLHKLNRTLQARRETVSGMVECVQTVPSSLSSKRTEDSYKSLLQHVMQKIEQLELDPLKLPTMRKPPKRLTGPAAAYQP